MTGEVTRALRIMQQSVDPIRGNIETLLQSPVERHPDQDLLDLGQRWKTLDAAYDRAVDRWSAADDLVDRPDAPEAVFFRESDRAFGFERLVVRRADNRLWFCLYKHAERANAALRRCHRRGVRRPVRPDDRLPADAISVEEMHPWPEKQARADEITQAWDHWRAEINRLDEQAGLPALDAVVLDLAHRSNAVADQIEAASARTLAGLRVKAELAQALDAQENDVGPTFWADLVCDILLITAGGGAA